MFWERLPDAGEVHLDALFPRVFDEVKRAPGKGRKDAIGYSIVGILWGCIVGLLKG